MQITLLVMHAVIKCDVLHRYHHLPKMVKINQSYVGVHHAVFLEINNFYFNKI